MSIINDMQMYVNVSNDTFFVFIQVVSYAITPPIPQIFFFNHFGEKSAKATS